MILKSIIKKIFVAAFALLVFQQVWAEENSEIRTAKVRVLVTPGSEWKGKFPPQFALWIQDSDGNFSRTIFSTRFFAVVRVSVLASIKPLFPSSEPVPISSSFAS